MTNCGTWTIYGFAIGDIWVWGPNLAGFLLGVVQLLLKMLYPSVVDDKTRQRLCKATGSDGEPEEP